MKQAILLIISSVVLFIVSILMINLFLNNQETISTVQMVFLCSLSVSFMGIAIVVLATGLAELGGFKNENK